LVKIGEKLKYLKLLVLNMKDNNEAIEIGKSILRIVEKADNPENLLRDLHQLLFEADTFVNDIQNALRNIVINFLTRNVIYKATIQSGRRISIPEEEMRSAGIKEGDIVQVIIIPLKHIEKNLNESNINNNHNNKNKG
jgi:hypothetical protein